MIFCGVFSYRPNAEGVLWFAESIWPAIRQARPDARLLLVGSGATRAVRHLASRGSSIEVIGTVSEVPPYLWRSAVAVAPLRLARGVQNKVLEALAAGLPVVVTPAVAGGLPAEVLPGCAVAEEAGAFGAAVVNLLSCQPEDRRRIASTVNLDVMRWSEQLQRVEGLLRGAVNGAQEGA